MYSVYMVYITFIKEVPGEPLGSTSLIRGLSLVFDWYSRYLDVVRLRGASSPVTYISFSQLLCVSNPLVVPGNPVTETALCRSPAVSFSISLMLLCVPSIF